MITCINNYRYITTDHIDTKMSLCTLFSMSVYCVYIILFVQTIAFNHDIINIIIPFTVDSACIPGMVASIVPDQDMYLSLCMVYCLASPPQKKQ